MHLISAALNKRQFFFLTLPKSLKISEISQIKNYSSRFHDDFEIPEFMKMTRFTQLFKLQKNYLTEKTQSEKS